MTDPAVVLTLPAPIGRRAFAEALRCAERITVLPGARGMRIEFAIERRARRVARLQRRDMAFEAGREDWRNA